MVHPAWSQPSEEPQEPQGQRIGWLRLAGKKLKNSSLVCRPYKKHLRNNDADAFIATLPSQKSSCTKRNQSAKLDVQPKYENINLHGMSVWFQNQASTSAGAGGSSVLVSTFPGATGASRSKKRAAKIGWKKLKKLVTCRPYKKRLRNNDDHNPSLPSQKSSCTHRLSPICKA